MGDSGDGCVVGLERCATFEVETFAEDALALPCRTDSVRARLPRTFARFEAPPIGKGSCAPRANFPKSAASETTSSKL